MLEYTWPRPCGMLEIFSSMGCEKGLVKSGIVLEGYVSIHKVHQLKISRTRAMDLYQRPVVKEYEKEMGSLEYILVNGLRGIPYMYEV
jgi:hypothetical protein